MILEVEKLAHGFLQPGGARIEVLAGLELSVEQGETVAILGESGSGKSTLLTLLSGLDHPDDGGLRIDGRELTDLSEEELARFRAERIGIVFQNYQLMGGLTALENVALPLELAHVPDAENRARDLLDEVGLHDRADHFPSQLSGGECQRVAIARAIVTHPALLLADEPSGSLDARTGERVMDILFDLVGVRGMTLILVTHSEALASRCGRRLLLSGGQLRDQA